MGMTEGQIAPRLTEQQEGNLWNTPPPPPSDPSQCTAAGSSPSITMADLWYWRVKCVAKNCLTTEHLNLWTLWFSSKMPDVNFYHMFATSWYSFISSLLNKVVCVCPYIFLNLWKSRSRYDLRCILFNWWQFRRLDKIPTSIFFSCEWTMCSIWIVVAHGNFIKGEPSRSVIFLTW